MQILRLTSPRATVSTSVDAPRLHRGSWTSASSGRGSCLRLLSVTLRPVEPAWPWKDNSLFNGQSPESSNSPSRFLLPRNTVFADLLTETPLGPGPRSPALSTSLLLARALPGRCHLQVTPRVPAGSARAHLPLMTWRNLKESL